MKHTRKPPKQIGDKFTLNCGVEVEIIEKVPGTLRVVLQDSLGRRKEAFSGAVGVGEVSWLWTDVGLPAEYHNESKVKLGHTYTLNCGVDVKVVSMSPIVVEDHEGNRKEVQSNPLRTGNVSWKEFGVPSSHKGSRQVLLWDYIELSCGITVQLVEYIGCDRVRVEDDCGNSKWTAMSQLTKGMVSWKEFGARSPSNIDKRFFVGQKRKSKKHGWYSVYEIHSSSDVVIVWDDYEGLQSVSAQKIDHNTVKPDVVHWNYLQVDLEKYYVYIVIHNQEIIYVGKGIGNRYTHATNGRSNNYFLNKLHFEGEDAKVIIYKEVDTNAEAVAIEKELIVEYYPRYNTADKPKEPLEKYKTAEVC